MKKLILILASIPIIGAAQIKGYWASDSTVATTVNSSNKIINQTVVKFAEQATVYRVVFTSDYKIFFMISKVNGEVLHQSINKVVYLPNQYVTDEASFPYKILPNGQLYVDNVIDDEGNSVLIQMYYSRVN